MKVGFIGLGRMGQGMARRLLGGGHDLVVFNRTREKSADLANAGASVAASVADACRDREVVISIVADDTAVKEVTLGQGGVKSSLSSGAVHLVMGTHSVATVQMLAAAHAESNQLMISAPVMGRPDVAAAGQLAIIAGGAADAIRRCEPLFQLMGRRAFYAAPKPKAPPRSSCP